LIASGNAFVNPCGAGLVALSTSSSLFSTNLTSVAGNPSHLESLYPAANFAVHGISSITIGVLVTTQFGSSQASWNSQQSFTDCVSKFHNHTNVLSGVSPPTPGTSQQSMSSVLSMARTLDAVNKTTSACTNILAAFGSIFNGPVLINDILNQLNALMQAFMLGVTTMAAIMNAINRFKALINALMNIDIAALENMMIQLAINAIGASLASIIGDKCATSLIKNIGTPALTSALKI
jgi:hypothetical protein